MPGRAFNYGESETVQGQEYYKIGYKKNKIVFSRKHIDKMWNGLRPLEDINHEVIHANDFFRANYWVNRETRLDIISSSIKTNSGERLTQWMEIRAYTINYNNTGDPAYLNALNKYLPW